jgi:hypothetical protein
MMAVKPTPTLALRGRINESPRSPQSSPEVHDYSRLKQHAWASVVWPTTSLAFEYACLLMSGLASDENRPSMSDSVDFPSKERPRE